MVVTLAVWMLCAGISVKLATMKGRPGFPWGIWGFLFGPFAVALLLMIGDGDSIKKCPKCYGTIDVLASVCMDCQAALLKPGPVNISSSAPYKGILWGEGAGKESVASTQDQATNKK